VARKSPPLPVCSLPQPPVLDAIVEFHLSGPKPADLAPKPETRRSLESDLTASFRFSGSRRVPEPRNLKLGDLGGWGVEGPNPCQQVPTIRGGAGSVLPMVSSDPSTVHHPRSQPWPGSSHVQGCTAPTPTTSPMGCRHGFGTTPPCRHTQVARPGARSHTDTPTRSPRDLDLPVPLGHSHPHAYTITCGVAVTCGHTHTITRGTHSLWQHWRGPRMVRAPSTTTPHRGSRGHGRRGHKCPFTPRASGFGGIKATGCCPKTAGSVSGRRDHTRDHGLVQRVSGSGTAPAAWPAPGRLGRSARESAPASAGSPPFPEPARRGARHGRRPYRHRPIPRAHAGGESHTNTRHAAGQPAAPEQNEAHCQWVDSVPRSRPGSG
jgi:hypothetical protein